MATACDPASSVGGDSLPSDTAVDNSSPASPDQELKPSTPVQNTPRAAKLRYSRQTMLDIFNQMDLSVITAKPQGWAEDRICVAISAEVVENLFNLQTCLKEPVRALPSPEFMRSMYSQPLQRRASWDRSAQGNPAFSSSFQQAGPSYAMPPQLRPIKTHLNTFKQQRSYGAGVAADSPSTRFSQSPSSATSCSTTPYHTGPMPPTKSSSLNLPDLTELGWDSFEGPDSFKSGSSIPCRMPSKSSTAAAATPTHQPTAIPYGSPLWQQTVSKLLGLDGRSGTSGVLWLVQQPHLAGAMGPIPAEDMAAWLLQRVPPKQLHRPVHKPMLEAVAANPAALLVCGLMPAELQQGLRPASAAFKPLTSLLPGLAAGLEYSIVMKDLVDTRHPGQAASKPPAASMAAAAPTNPQADVMDVDSVTDTPTAAMPPSAFMCHADSAFSIADSQPGTPATPFRSSASTIEFRKRFAPESCPSPHLVSQLQQMPMFEVTGMTAAAEEICSRARRSNEDRALLVAEGAVPALVKLLQLPLDISITEGQPHAAAAWALFHLLGRSKDAPQGCPAAQAAMSAAAATRQLTAVLKAVCKHGGAQPDPLMASRLLRTASTASCLSTSSSLGGSQDSSVKVKEAAAAALSGLATTAAGKQDMLQAGTVPSIIRLLGSRYPGVVTAAVSVIRNLTTPQSHEVLRALFKAGASTMLAHVVACIPDPACKQNALRILQDLATSAPPSPKTTSTAGADLSDLLAQQAQTEDYTADSVIDRLVRRGLPVVLLKLLHAAPQVSLQARAMKLLQLLAAARQEVLVSIKELVEYEIVPGQDKQQASYTGIQVLQGLMRSSSSTVQGGAVEVLQALADAGLIGRGAKQGKSAAPAALLSTMACK